MGWTCQPRACASFSPSPLPRQDARSIKDQRESLPIFKLKPQLIEAVRDNQVRRLVAGGWRLGVVVGGWGVPAGGWVEACPRAPPPAALLGEPPLQPLATC
jgi:hypothetical protein